MKVNEGNELNKKSEKDKMLAQDIYDAYDEELVGMRIKCANLTKQFNETSKDKKEERVSILNELLGKCGNNIFMTPAINFDYGCNTYIGDNFYSNFNLTILDCAPVYIGNHVLIGPNVTLATPIHPFWHTERRFQESDGKIKLLEYAKSIYIGNDVWIASNVVINGGVKIGDCSIIGSGSVVTKDIPDSVIAAGNPCRVIRKITEADKILI